MSTIDRPDVMSRGLAHPVRDASSRCRGWTPPLRALAGLGVIALAGGCSLGRLWEPTTEDVLRRILPSAVQIVVEQPEGRRVRTGSGVVIASAALDGSSRCLVLTSGHTVAETKGQREIVVILGQDRGQAVKATAAVLAARVADDMDVALLAIRADPCAPARAGRPPALGDPVWVVGFPMGQALTLARGVVSQLGVRGAADRLTITRLMVDAPVSYGSSGGGVYAARDGGLVGIVEGYSTARVSAQGVEPAWFIEVPVPGHTLVTPLSDVQRFLAQSGQEGLMASDWHLRRP